MYICKIIIYQEMDRIRRDMLQLREANGLYIAHDNWR